MLPIRQRLCKAALLCAGCLLAAVTASASFINGPVVLVYPDPPPIPPLERGKPLWRLSQQMHYGDAASVPHTGGQMSTVSATAKVEYFLRTREQFISADFSYRWKSFNWNNSPNYITDTGAYEINIIAEQKLDDDDWSFVGLVSSQMEAEYNGGDIPSSISYQFGGSIQYEMTPRLKLGLGVAVSDSPLNTVRVWPMLLLHWKINQQLTLSSSNGLKLVFEPDADKTNRFDLAVSYNSSYIGLHTQETLPGQFARPIVRDTSIDLVAGVEHQLNPWLRLRAAVDGRVYSEYEFYQDKTHYNTLRPDPSIGFSLRAIVIF